MDENLHHFSLCIRWCVIYHDIQPFVHILMPLSIHQWVHGLVWYTTVQATKQGDNIHTDHIKFQGCAMGRCLKILTRFASLLGYVWWIMSSNHPYTYWHPSQFINMCMLEVYATLYMQPFRRSHPYWPHNTTRMSHGWVDGLKNWHTFNLCLGWSEMTTSSNHPHTCWRPYKFTNRCMCEVDTQLVK